jgi:hypothetical protein
VLKAQDILVCLYLAVTDGQGQTYAQIAEALKISVGTAHSAALRARAAKLLMTREFVAALAGHLPGEDIARVPQRLRRMIELQIQ